MDRRTFVKGSAALAGAATLPTVYAQAQAAPDKIRFGHSQKGSLIIDSPTMTLEELEKEYILKVLNYTRWQKKRSSELLGINASTLYRKLISYGIDRPGVGHGEEGLEETGHGTDERAA